MKQVLLRWILIGLAVLAVGPFLAMVMSLIDGREGFAATPLNSELPMVSGALGILCVGVAAGFGWLAARLGTVGLGLFCAGCAIGWIAYNSARPDELIRISQSTSPLWVLVAEGALFSLFGVAAAYAILGRAVRATVDEELVGPQGLLGAAVSLLVAAVAAWVLARESTPGQAMAATGIATMFGIAAGRSVAPHASLLSCIAGILIIAIIGPAAGAMLQGADVVEAAYSNALFPLARLTPLDWLAGAFLGAPIGAVWAASMLEKKTEPEPPARGRIHSV